LVCKNRGRWQADVSQSNHADFFELAHGLLFSGQILNDTC
jgi:hypothetical protein